MVSLSFQPILKTLGYGRVVFDQQNAVGSVHHFWQTSSNLEGGHRCSQWPFFRLNCLQGVDGGGIPDEER